MSPYTYIDDPSQAVTDPNIVKSNLGAAAFNRMEWTVSIMGCHYFDAGNEVNCSLY